MSARRKIFVPIAVLVGAFGLIGLIFGLRQPVKPRPPVVSAPVVRTLRAAPETVKLTVRAYGTVVPRTESDLVPQVSGEVVWVSPSLVSGGFFEQGEPLVRIDRADYEAELESARASVARARSQLSRARKERKRQQRLADRSAASESNIDDAENSYQVAQATLREANARLGRTERDLDRTELRAPYAGRVREEKVDVGQFAQRGTAIGTLYAIDYAEVRLPVPDRELAYIDLPVRWVREPVAPLTAPARAPDEAQAGDAARLEAMTSEARSVEAAPAPRVEAPPSGPLAVLRAEFMGVQHEWTGRVVRWEGELDPRSRMVNLVVRVEDPYGRNAAPRAAADAGDGLDDPPLTVGLFVEVEIEGRLLDGAVVLPNTALRVGPEGDAVMVVDADSRLRFRAVEVARVEPDRVVIRDGIAAGEEICISPLRAAVEGMRVQPAREPTTRRVAGARDPAPAADDP